MRSDGPALRLIEAKSSRHALRRWVVFLSFVTCVMQVWGERAGGMGKRIDRARRSFEAVLDHDGPAVGEEVEATYRELLGLTDRADQLEILIEQGRRHIRWLMNRAEDGAVIQGPATGDGLVAAFTEGFENLHEELEAHRVWVEKMILCVPQISRNDSALDGRLIDGMFDMVEALVRLENRVTRLSRRVQDHSW